MMTSTVREKEKTVHDGFTCVRVKHELRKNRRTAFPSSECSASSHRDAARAAALTAARGACGARGGEGGGGVALGECQEVVEGQARAVGSTARSGSRCGGHPAAGGRSRAVRAVCWRCRSCHARAASSHPAAAALLAARCPAPAALATPSTLALALATATAVAPAVAARLPAKPLVAAAHASRAARRPGGAAHGLHRHVTDAGAVLCELASPAHRERPARSERTAAKASLRRLRVLRGADAISLSPQLRPFAAPRPLANLGRAFRRGRLSPRRAAGRASVAPSLLWLPPGGQLPACPRGVPRLPAEPAAQPLHGLPHPTQGLSPGMEPSHPGPHGRLFQHARGQPARAVRTSASPPLCQPHIIFASPILPPRQPPSVMIVSERARGREKELSSL